METSRPRFVVLYVNRDCTFVPQSFYSTLPEAHSVAERECRSGRVVWVIELHARYEPTWLVEVKKDIYVTNE